MAGIWDQWSAVLKEDYLGPIREQINQSAVFYAQLKKSSEEVVGKHVYLPLHFGRNTGVGARGTTGTATLPTAGAQGYKECTFLTKDVYGRVNVYGKAIRATRNDKGAFVRAIDAEMKGLVNDLTEDLNRQLMGDTTAQLTTATTTANSATVGVVSTQYLWEGMKIDIDSDTNQEILSIDSATQITMTAAVDHANGDVIKRTGVTSGDELNGLGLMFTNASTMQGLAPGTYSWWKAQVYGTAGVPMALSLTSMQECVDAAEKAGGKVNFALTGYAGRRAYMALLQPQQVFTDTTTLKGGFKSVLFNDIPLTVDRMVPESSTESRIYFLSLDDLGIYRMADFEWVDQDGSVWARSVGASATESFEATLVCDLEFATNARNRQACLLGVKV